MFPGPICFLCVPTLSLCSLGEQMTRMGNHLVFPLFPISPGLRDCVGLEQELILGHFDGCQPKGSLAGLCTTWIVVYTLGHIKDNCLRNRPPPSCEASQVSCVRVCGSFVLVAPLPSSTWNLKKGTVKRRVLLKGLRV